MKRIPRISALMTAFPWHLPGDTSAREARLFMQEHDIHHLPVTDDQHRLLGLVTLDALPSGSDKPLAQLVVLIHRERLAGIFTWTDACRQFALWLREPFQPNDGDDVA